MKPSEEKYTEKAKQPIIYPFDSRKFTNLAFGGPIGDIYPNLLFASFVGITIHNRAQMTFILSTLPVGLRELNFCRNKFSSDFIGAFTRKQLEKFGDLKTLRICQQPKEFMCSKDSKGLYNFFSKIFCSLKNLEELALRYVSLTDFSLGKLCGALLKHGLKLKPLKLCLEGNRIKLVKEEVTANLKADCEFGRIFELNLSDNRELNIGNLIFFKIPILKIQNCPLPEKVWLDKFLLQCFQYSLENNIGRQIFHESFSFSYFPNPTQGIGEAPLTGETENNKYDPI